ncbi:MAG: hypothetical protein ACYC4P_09490 [Thermoanaerobaculia bacterium]
MSSNDPFEGLVPPIAPPGLREDALRAGRIAVAETGAPSPDVWTLLLRSRALRAAWWTVVVALAAAHAFLPATRPAPVSAQPLPAEVASAAHVAMTDDRTDRLVRACGLEGEPL